MLSASAFGSADNSYLDLDYSGYHKNLIKGLFIIIIIIIIIIIYIVFQTSNRYHEDIFGVAQRNKAEPKESR